MQWNDNAIITSLKKHGENAAIATMLTQNHGLHSGMIHNITSPAKRSIYQIGNIVEVIWKARLSEHLGSFTAEVVAPISSYLLFNYLSLTGLNSICSIINSCLIERLEEKTIFSEFYKLLFYMKDNSEEWKKEYVLFEMMILSELGFGLDLNQCVVTGSTKNLIYISPKSGKAVSEEVGLEYKDKLLKMPEFFGNPKSNLLPKNIIEALKLTGFFLTKFFYSPKYQNLPLARTRFIEVLVNHYNEEVINK